MMNSYEFRHKEVISGRVRENEYEHIRQHVFEDQATGMLMVAQSDTQLGGLPKGAAGVPLIMGASLPQWGGRNLDVGAYDVRGATLTADTLTSGRMIFAGASGVLSDSAVLTWVAPALIIHTITAADPKIIFKHSGHGTAHEISIHLDESASHSILHFEGLTAGQRMCLRLIALDTNAARLYLTSGANSTILEHGGGDNFSITTIAGASILLQPNADTDDYFKFDTPDHIPSLYGAGAYLRIGDVAATNHSLASEDDLMASGKLEVKGIAYFDGAMLSASYHEFTEMAAPGTGAANTARIYAHEISGNGGLTELCAIFQDGSIDVFAVETTKPDSPIYRYPDETELRLVMKRPDKGTHQFVAVFPDGSEFIMRELRHPVGVK